MPSNRHVVIDDGMVALEEDHAGRPRPSVDLLLSTAAKSYGEHLIAVILTGSGSDGAIGSVEVKASGGTIIVQNPQTALYPSMPLALPPTIIDFEVDIQNIGPLLTQLLSGELTVGAQDGTNQILQNILELVGRQANIDFRPYKNSTILRRINRRMTVTAHHTIQDYALYLETHPEEVGELVQAFLINVTQFLRDAEAFTYLKTDILPQLITMARERDKMLRLWSAGCATGEEPYSLAMLLVDLLGNELSEWSIKIFATDVDEAAINFARRGLYTENLVKSVPADYRERFFEHASQGYRISKTLRQMVIFGQQDLSRSAPFPRIDMVVCRNVLIYFTSQLQDYVLNQFGFSLAPRGYLFLGKAETVRPSQSLYELVSKTWKIYRCNNSNAPFGRRQVLVDLTKRRSEEITRPTRLLGKLNTTEETISPSVELGQLRQVNELLLRTLSVGVLVIDRNYRLLTANSSARRFLGMRELANEQDFLHSVRGIPYTQVRAAIDNAFRERTTVTLPEVELDPTSGGNGRYVSLSIALVQLESGLPDLAAISVSDVTEQFKFRQQLETAQAEQTKLVEEIREANRRLNYLNKELTDANEELQVSNEELMLTQEELQASIEEFETTNEELQSTNEELETNNEELQATNEELRARTLESQEAAEQLENERKRLAEIVELAPFYIVVLRGPELVVEAYNPRYLPLLQKRSILGLPLSEVSELFQEGTSAIWDLAYKAYREDIQLTSPSLPTHLPDSEEAVHYLSYTIVPSHDVNDTVIGVVIYGQDKAAI